MPVLLFKLRNVPEEEVEAVKTLLDDQQINYYETSAGNWHVSMPALWLPDDSQLQQAKEILTEFEIELKQKAREELQALEAQGLKPTFLTQLKSNPITVIIYLTLVGIVLYFSITPFLEFGR